VGRRETLATGRKIHAHKIHGGELPIQQGGR
jgi:hypothetical protein